MMGDLPLNRPAFRVYRTGGATRERIPERKPHAKGGGAVGDCSRSGS